MSHIYLDHNATTPLLPEVAEAMQECYRSGFGNPASQHALGRQARQMLEAAREEIADLLGADLGSVRPDRLIFTSGGTEANNLALLGMAGAYAQPTSGGRAMAARFEHHSVLGSLDQLARRGWQIDWLTLDAGGTVDLEQAASLLDRADGQPRLAALMLANSEIGVLQPVAQFAALCQTAGIALHTDAVQVAGKLPVRFRELGAATLSIAAHKFNGPRGIGALLVRHDVQLAPQMFGGFQQEGLRPGTEPVALAVGMQRALRLWHAEQTERQARLCELRERFESQLLAGWPAAVVNGKQAKRLPHTSNIAFVGLNRQALLIALDLAGVACSTGSACASGSTDPSPTLVAMGCPGAVLESSLRFSLGVTTTAAEIDLAVERILKTCKHLQSQNNTRKLPQGKSQVGDAKFG